MEKKIKQVCACESCGNEAEMEFTCSFVEVDDNAAAAEAAPEAQPEAKKAKGTGVCESCGSEAEIWVDMGA